MGATATLLLGRSSRVVRGGARMVIARGAKQAMGMAGAMAAREVVGRATRAAGPMAADAADHLTRYAREARGAIDAAVEAEVRALRRAIRKQRRRVGL